MRCLDPLEHGEGELAARCPAVLIEQLELEGPEEAFGDAVIEAVADRAHRAQQPGAA
jgi:hypothetical protein